MLVMLQEVPESGWLCDECQAEVETEIEKKKLEKSQVNFVMVSMENKVDAEKVGHKELEVDNVTRSGLSWPLRRRRCNRPGGHAYEVSARYLM